MLQASKSLRSRLLLEINRLLRSVLFVFRFWHFCFLFVVLDNMSCVPSALKIAAIHVSVRRSGEIHNICQVSTST